MSAYPTHVLEKNLQFKIFQARKLILLYMIEGWGLFSIGCSILLPSKSLIVMFMKIKHPIHPLPEKKEEEEKEMHFRSVLFSHRGN